MELTFCLSLIFLVEISLARQVMVGPPTWKANKDNSTLITAMFGKFVVFKCPAQGNPKPNITWFKNNQLIDSNNTNNKYRIKRWKFKIKHVDIKDNGNYTCVVENEYGKITWTYQLKLKQGPPKRATSKGSSKIITELTGHEANLNCLAYGFPEPNITWFKNGNLIDLSHVKMDNVIFDQVWQDRYMLVIDSRNRTQATARTVAVVQGLGERLRT